MKLADLTEKCKFKVCCMTDDSRCVSKILCTDIHSYALGKLNENDVWITVSAHINTLAVAKRRNISCVILVDGIKPDDDFIRLAEENNVSVLLSAEPVYETVLVIENIMRKQYEIQ
ncbi:DRTGG domain-containing protein [Porcipelethomonas sp.]|uniref:DRTGG domain-containing protein n=1 Tax=Porcipelethomonas sp. TaxID=2981675 RepID=UPI003EF30F5C